MTDKAVTTAPGTPPGQPDRAVAGPRRRANPFQALLHSHPSLGPLVVLVVAAVIFDIINSRMFNPANLSIMLQEVAVIGLLALGQSIIILTAGIDLSVGAVMILAQMVMAGLAINSGLPVVLALVIGILVTRFHVPPFIATLGTLGVFTAAGLKYAN